MLTLIMTIIIGLLVVLCDCLMQWFSSVYTEMFYNAFAVENVFTGTGVSFNLSGLCTSIYNFAIALLIMFFIKKLVETYFSWSNGDPETSPFSVLLGFIKALIIIICFGFIYETFVTIFYSLFESLCTAAFGDVSFSEDISSTNLNLFGAIVLAIACVYFVLIWFQNLGRGIEILILRLGIPFACIGLLNADGGAFRGYVQKFIKSAFTVIVQLLLLRLAVVLITAYHYVLTAATVTIAYKTPSLLQEFMQTSGGYYGEIVGKGKSYGQMVLANITTSLKNKTP